MTLRDVYVEPEPYLTRKELAALLAISIATVDRMVADGCPSVRWGRRARRFLLSEVVAWGHERGKIAA